MKRIEGKSEKKIESLWAASSNGRRRADSSQMTARLAVVRVKHLV